MKKKTTKMALSLAILAIITIFYTNLSIAATITKPRKEDPNASIHVRGITTYYNWDNQAWKKMDGSLLYSYKGKKITKYYKPIFYLTNLWLANNGKNIVVDLGASYSKSVQEVVSQQLNIGTTKANVELATSVSSSYSKTVSYSYAYSTKYTFDMSLYSKKYSYRPAAYGNILEFYTVRKNRITGNDKYIGNTYTFDNKEGFDLKLAWKN